MPIAAPTWPQATTVDEIRHNLEAVRERIVRACALAGRDPAGVRLLPVSKTVDEARLRMAWEAGCHELGENKVQEAQRKAAAMADLPGLRWSVIGHLQTNKARDVARFASEFQALDSLRVAQALDQRLALEQRTLDGLLPAPTAHASGHPLGRRSTGDTGGAAGCRPFGAGISARRRPGRSALLR